MSGPEIIIADSPAPMGSGAAQLREAFAQRHVPLPATLARALAAFLASRQPLLDPIWGKSFACMAKSLGISGAVGGQALMTNALSRFPVIVAEPILRHAVRQTGQLPLSGTSADTVSSGRFEAAEAAVEQATNAALADPDVMGKPFWVHAALDLRNNAVELARSRARLRGSDAAEQTECDPALAALVFLHPPRFDVTRQHERPRRKASHLSAHRRAGIRPKEGGVAGIRQSRSLEDMPDAMLSEMIQGRGLLANKLLHEGLLVRHRPPRRDPRRDLLAMSLLLADRDDGLGLLVKAAWADAAIRLRVALSQMGLVNSDLVWSQEGSAPAILDCNIREPGHDLLPPLAIEGRVRADMLMRWGLFPGLAVLPARPAAKTGQEAADASIRRLWHSGLGPLAAARRRDPASLPGDYGRRMVMICQPQTSPGDWSELRAELSAALGRAAGGKTHLACLTWRSGAAEEPPELLGFSDGRTDLELTLPLPSADHPDDALADFMGALVGWIMDVTLEALDVAQA